MIESSGNRLIKKIRALDTRKGRDEHGAFIVEGEKFISEISGYEIESIAVSEEYYRERQDFLKRFPCPEEKLNIIKDSLFKAMSDTVSPQGIIAVCAKRYHDFDSVKKNFLVLLDDISDPGNMGTIIRTADAFGATGVLLTKNCVDIYSAKVVRSTAGSLFHLPVIEDIDTDIIIDKLKSSGVAMISTLPSDGVYPAAVDFSAPFCIMLGNEAHGLSLNLNRSADLFVKIPMPGQAESLNVSIAAGIIMYEAARQRMNNQSGG